ncbi:unnamed protein product [Pedinophyceae sp. YPF-701]|nr:unnamed protein product [Pedinophyceae sp. YPF-701]
METIRLVNAAFRPQGSPHAVIRDASLTLCQGELVAIIGPSGAGKSTLLKILGGHNAGNLSGYVRVCGKRLAELHASHGPPPVAYSPQEDLLVRALTPRQTLVYMAQLALPDLTKEGAAARAEELLGRFGLLGCADTPVGEDGSPGGISGGQRRRLSLLTDLLTRPRFLLADEPTSGLDSTASETLARELRLLATRDNVGVIATIHQPSDSLLAHFDRVVALQPLDVNDGLSGSIAYAGPVHAARGYLAALGYDLPSTHSVAECLLGAVTEAIPAPERLLRDAVFSVASALAREWSRSRLFLLFQAADTDGSGGLTARELTAVVASQSARPRAEVRADVEGLFGAAGLDVQRDEIDYLAFIAMAAAAGVDDAGLDLERLSHAAQAAERKLSDGIADGVPRDRFPELLETLSLELPAAAQDKLFTALDANGNGHVEASELVMWLAAPMCCSMLQRNDSMARVRSLTRHTGYAPSKTEVFRAGATNPTMRQRAEREDSARERRSMQDSVGPGGLKGQKSVSTKAFTSVRSTRILGILKMDALAALRVHPDDSASDAGDLESEPVAPRALTMRELRGRRGWVRRGAEWAHQARVLLAREVAGVVGAPRAFLSTLLSVLIIAVVIGIMFGFLGNSQERAFERVAGLFIALGFLAVKFGLEFATAMPPRKAILRRELTNGYYSLPAFFLSQVSVLLLHAALLAPPYTAVVYFLVSDARTAEGFLITLAAFAMMAVGGGAIGMLFGALMPTPGAASTLMIALIDVFVLFSGFLLRGPSMPAYLKWIWYISPTNYVQQILVSAEFGSYQFGPCSAAAGDSCPYGEGVVPGAAVQSFFGYDDGDTPLNFGVLAGMVAGYLVCVYFVLRQKVLLEVLNAVSESVVMDKFGILRGTRSFELFGARKQHRRVIEAAALEACRERMQRLPPLADVVFGVSGAAEAAGVAGDRPAGTMFLRPVSVSGGELQGATDVRLELRCAATESTHPFRAHHRTSPAHCEDGAQWRWSDAAWQVPVTAATAATGVAATLVVSSKDGVPLSAPLPMAVLEGARLQPGAPIPMPEDLTVVTVPVGGADGASLRVAVSYLAAEDDAVVRDPSRVRSDALRIAYEPGVVTAKFGSAERGRAEMRAWVQAQVDSGAMRTGDLMLHAMSLKECPDATWKAVVLGVDWVLDNLMHAEIVIVVDRPAALGGGKAAFIAAVSSNNDDNRDAISAGFHRNAVYIWPLEERLDIPIAMFWHRMVRPLSPTQARRLEAFVLDRWAHNAAYAVDTAYRVPLRALPCMHSAELSSETLDEFTCATFVAAACKAARLPGMDGLNTAAFAPWDLLRTGLWRIERVVVKVLPNLVHRYGNAVWDREKADGGGQEGVGEGDDE